MHQGVRQRAPLLQSTNPVSKTRLLSSETISQEKTRQEQMEHMEVDRIMRLKQEADKIRKWKVQMELELKLKDNSIVENQQIIEKLRQSSLELQLENENISHKLEEEFRTKEEILHKIDATRKMCGLLKEYATKLDDRMQKCEVEKAEIKYTMKEQTQHFESLTERFQNLEITATATQTKLQSELERERDAKIGLEMSFRSQHEKLQSELNGLVKECEAKDEQISQLCNQLSCNKIQIETFKSEQETLQSTITKLQDEVQLKEQCIEETQLSLKQTKETVTDLEAKLDKNTSRLNEAVANKEKTTKKFYETERLYGEMLKKNQNDKDCLQEILQAEIKRSNELQSWIDQLQKDIEQLKAEKETVETEACERQERLKDLKAEKERQEIHIEDLQKQISKLSDDNHGAHSELVELRLNMDKCKTLLEETEENLVRKTTNLEKCNTDNIILKEEIEKHKEQLGELNSELDSSREKEQELAQEIEQLKQQLESESDENKQTIEKTSSLKTENKTLQRDLNKLTNELEKTKKKETDFKSKFYDAKKEINELRLAKANLEDLTKEEVDKAQNALQAEIQEKEGVMLKLKDCESKLQEKASELESLEGCRKTREQNITALHNQLKEANAVAEKAKRDFETADKRCEMEIAQMAKVLADYKKEYDQLFVEKDREIEALQEELKTSKQTNNEELKEREKSAETTKCQLKELMMDLKALKASSSELSEKLNLQEADIKEKNDEIADLKRRNLALVSEKVDELAELNKQIDDLKIAKKTPVPSTPLISRPASEDLKKHTPKSSITLSIRRAPALKDCSTPKLPLRGSMAESPLGVIGEPRTPINNRSILKSANTQSAKKRRVMFASGSGGLNSDGNESENSSASEPAMEIDINEVEKRLKTPTRYLANAPALTKPSPLIKSTTKSPLKSAYQNVSRQWNKVDLMDVKSDTRSEQNSPLASEAMSSEKVKKSSAISSAKSKENVRKTPSRPAGKIFAASPKERKESKMQALRKQKEPEDFAWFENDAIFGFGPED